MKLNLMMIGFLAFVVFGLNRTSINNVIRKSLPAIESGIVSGILIGDKSGFDSNFYNNLINTGLVHLVVVSGSNVILLVGGLIENLAKYWGRKRSIVTGLVTGWWYVVVVGWELPIIRAMLMLTMLYVGQLWGRRFYLGRSLFFSVLIMSISDLRIWWNVSFWLSLMSFLALVLIRVKEWLKPVWVGIWIFPITAFIFKEVSLIFWITNLLVITMVEMLSVVGAIGVIGGVIWPQLGKIIFWIMMPMLKYFRWIVDWGSEVKMVEISFNWLMVIGYYLILIYLLIKYKAKVAVN